MGVWWGDTVHTPDYILPVYHAAREVPGRTCSEGWWPSAWGRTHSRCSLAILFLRHRRPLCHPCLHRTLPLPPCCLPLQSLHLPHLTTTIHCDNESNLGEFIDWRGQAIRVSIWTQSLCVHIVWSIKSVGEVRAWHSVYICWIHSESDAHYLLHSATLYISNYLNIAFCNLLYYMAAKCEKSVSV